MKQQQLRNQEKLWNAGFIIITIGYFLCSTAQYMTNSTFSLYVNFLGGTASFSGISTALFAIANVIARLVSGRMADSVGRKPVLIMGGVCFLIPAIVFAVSGNFALLLVMRFLQGFGYAAMNTAQNTVAADTIPEGRLSEGMGYFSSMLAVSAAIGPQISLMILGDNRFSMVYTVMAAVVFLSLAMGLCSKERTAAVKEIQTQTERKGLVEFIKNTIEPKAIPAGIVVFVAYMGISAILVFTTLYATKRGFSNPGFFFTIAAVVMFTVKLLSGSLNEKFGTAATIGSSLVLGAVTFVILAFIHNQTLFFACAVLYGAFQASLLPVLTAAAVRCAPAERRGAAISTFYMFVDVGVGAGSALWGAMIDLWDFDVMFCAAAVLLLVGAVMSILFFRNKK